MLNIKQLRFSKKYIRTYIGIAPSKLDATDNVSL